MVANEQDDEIGSLAQKILAKLATVKVLFWASGNIIVHNGVIYFYSFRMALHNFKTKWP